MVDRLVHHAEVLVLKGDSYRLRGKGEEVLTDERKAETAQVSTGDSCSGLDRR